MDEKPSSSQHEEQIAEAIADEVPKTPKSPSGSVASTSGGGNWGLWGWVESAKSKSVAVLEAVKKDLDELSTVVKEEASAASEALGLNQADSTVGVMKKSISSFLGQVSDVLVPPVEDEESEAIMITKDGMVTLSGFAKHLAELQQNDATYLQEPAEELASQYKRWLEVIEQDQFTEPRILKQLSSSQILNEKYLNLVPGQVAHMEFWKRYLFKKALLEDAVANAEQVTRRAEQEVASTQTVVPETIIVQTEQPKAPLPSVATTVDEPVLEDYKKWEDDCLASGDIELSEEEQARLLEEYEKEIKERDAEPPKKQPAAGKKQASKAQAQNKSQSAKATKNQNQKNVAATKGGAKNVTKKKAEATKEDTTSDESWEKDFDDLDQQ